MESVNRYSAEGVVRLLRSAGFNINKRTVNYYAFDKKIIDVSETGKKCFTDVELDKIQAILLLRERTDFSLEEIKDIVNSSKLAEIKRHYPKIEPQFLSFASSQKKSVYQVEIYDNHVLLLIDDKRVLLGTGATFSIGLQPFEFMESKFPLRNTYLGTNIKEISQLLDTPIDVLLGGDILKEYYFIVDIDEKLATFSTVPLDFVGQPLPLDLVLNVPVTQFEVSGKALRSFFDISAKVSYLKKEFTENYPQNRTETDFYLGIGRFETGTYDIPVKLAGNHMTLQFGQLPDLLNMALAMANCDGIFGFELFRYFSAMYFNLQGRLIILKPRAVPLESWMG